MTIEEGEKELNEYIQNKALIRGIEEDIEKYRAAMLSITAKISDMPTGRNAIQDKIAEYTAIILDLQKEKYNYLIVLESQKANTESKIRQLEQPYRNILYFKYIYNKKLDEISERINYSYKWTCDLHRKAIEKYIEL